MIYWVVRVILGRDPLASFLKGQGHLRVVTRPVPQRRWLGHTWQPACVLICSGDSWEVYSHHFLTYT